MNADSYNHAAFREDIAAYLAGGLEDARRQSFEAHARACEACGGELRAAGEADAAIKALFASDVPDREFEDRIIQGLRDRAGRKVGHPMLWKMIGSIAAAVLFGGFGYLGQVAQEHGFPSFSPPRLFSLSSPPAPTETPEATSELEATASDIGRQQPVDALIRSARGLIDRQRYQEALGVIDQILIIDPSNEYAAGVRPLVEDKASFLEKRRSGALPSRGLSKQLNQAEEKKIPFDDILRYPSKWAEISEQHAGAGDAESAFDFWNGRGRVLDEPTAFAAPIREVRDMTRDIPDFSDAPQFSLSIAPAASAPGERAAVFGSTGENKPDGGGGAAAGETTVTGTSAPVKEREYVSNLQSVATSSDGDRKESESSAGYYTYRNDAPAIPKSGDGYVKPTEVAAANENKQTPVAGTAPLIVSSAGPVARQPAKQQLQQMQNSLEGQQIPQVETEKNRVAERPNTAYLGVPDRPGGAAGQVAQADVPAGTMAVPLQVPATGQVAGRKIIRQGEIEFEVDSFDSAYATISKIVSEEGGYIATTNSEKLPNGKMKGTITLRVPPDRLDLLVLKLRALGDLRGQRITAQDITKQYTDLESELRAARAMQERLLEIIKSGKGEIKDLLEAEKQLGEWRTKIEKLEGEIRYYNNLVAMSTLAVTLYEKDIKTPTAAYETETVNMGIEAEDVEKSRAEAIKLIDEKKGRIIASDLKKSEGDRLSASITAEVPYEAAGPLTDQLKQLGKVTRFDIDRKQTTQGGTGAPSGIKVERRDTRFVLSLYNLANVTPRQTVNVNLAAADVEAAYKAILAAVAAVDPDQAASRILSSTLNRQRSDQATASLQIQVKSEQAAALEAAIRAAGEVMSLTMAENADVANVTSAKRGFAVQIFSVATISPRETRNLQFAATSVPDAYRKLMDTLQAPKVTARILNSNLNEQDRRNITASVDFEARREDLPAIEAVLSMPHGEVFTRTVTRSSDTDNTLDSKVRLQLSMINAERLAPRQTTRMAVETGDVESVLVKVTSLAAAAEGRTLESNLSKERSGQVTARLVVDVPLAKSAELVSKVEGMGTVRARSDSRNPQVPEGALARGRLELTLGTGKPIAGADRTMWATFREGLATSWAGLLWSIQLVVIGVCLVAPWLIILWVLWRLFKRFRPRPAAKA